MRNKKLNFNHCGDIDEMQAAIRSFCKERDWDQFHNPKDLALSLVLEASEVVEHFQWKNNKEMSDHLIKNKSAVGEELADVLYWVLRMSDRFDIDIVEAFNNKMAKNSAKYALDKSKGNHKKYTEL